MKKGGKAIRHRKKSKPPTHSSEEDDDLLVRILNQKVAADISLSKVISPSTSRFDFDSALDPPPHPPSQKAPLFPSNQATPPSSVHQISAKAIPKSDEILISQLETTRNELKSCRKEYQKSLSTLKTALAEVQQSVTRRNEEIKTVITRCVRDLEAIFSAPEAKKQVNDVVFRLVRLVTTENTSRSEGQTTDRSAASSLEQCKARLDVLRTDFLSLKEQKSRLEADFRLQIAQKDENIANLLSEIAILKANNPSPPLISSVNQSQDWDLPLQMRCFSAAASPGKFYIDSEAEDAKMVEKEGNKG